MGPLGPKLPRAAPSKKKIFFQKLLIHSFVLYDCAKIFSED
jgi:hypothetical protein